jgi:protein-tyrosine-phosphatase
VTVSRPGGRPSVLFVCVKNSGKSQMAAALMRQLAGDAVEVYSAGTNPGDRLNEQSAQAVEELGATFAGEQPKPIDPEVLARVDRVIVTGGDARVDPLPGMAGRIEVWETDEPSERGIEGMERMRLVRDDLRRHVYDLAVELLGPDGVPTRPPS